MFAFARFSATLETKGKKSNSFRNTWSFFHAFLELHRVFDR